MKQPSLCRLRPPLTIALASRSPRRAPAPPAMLLSGPPTRASPRCLGNHQPPTAPDLRRLSLSLHPTRLADHLAPLVLQSAPPERPTFTGVPRVRRASSASTTGSATRTSSTSAGASTPVPSLVATEASGVPTRSTSTTSSATAARRVPMLKRWSSFFESASTGPVVSALLFTRLASAMLSTSPATSSLV